MPSVKIQASKRAHSRWIRNGSDTRAAEEERAARAPRGQAVLAAPSRSSASSRTVLIPMLVLALAFCGHTIKTAICFESDWPVAVGAPLAQWLQSQSAADGPMPQHDQGAAEEIFLLEDKDYPRSLFEDYSKKVGQVSGITTLPSDDVVIFHRAERQWNATSKFPMLAGAGNSSAGDRISLMDKLQQQLIKNDTLMIIDRENGHEVFTLGANLFYMPHSVASDPAGNLWVSDVGRHQVMRLPTANMGLRLRHDGPSRPQLPANWSLIWPDIVLGEAFAPGNDQAHFCQPAEIVVSADARLVFVADGYCNGRVVVFTGEGRFVGSFGEGQQMRVVHSLALIEERNLICAGDRENARILCFRAGLDGDLARLGQLVLSLSYPIGRVFAMLSLSQDHLLVSSNQFASSRYDLAILNPFTQELKLVWTSSDLLEPHSLARTFDRQYAYAADVSRDAFKKVFKFNVISKPN